MRWLFAKLSRGRLFSSLPKLSLLRRALSDTASALNCVSLSHMTISFQRNSTRLQTVPPEHEEARFHRQICLERNAYRWSSNISGTHWPLYPRCNRLSFCSSQPVLGWRKTPRYDRGSQNHKIANF